MITNLQDDEGLVARMHQALSGELNRRQELLRAAGNLVSVRDYERARQRGAPLAPLPNLLLVVDEFSELIAQREEFVDLFVQIGRLGRSLGLHLLLASQRLEEGKIRGLEAHLSYRIALRTFSAEESRAVLGVDEAYTLPSSPGHGLLRTDTTVLTRFRTAYVSGPYGDAAEAPDGLLAGPSEVRPFPASILPGPRHLAAPRRGTGGRGRPDPADRAERDGRADRRGRRPRAPGVAAPARRARAARRAARRARPSVPAGASARRRARAVRPDRAPSTCPTSSAGSRSSSTSPGPVATSGSSAGHGRASRPRCGRSWPRSRCGTRPPRCSSTASTSPARCWRWPTCRTSAGSPGGRSPRSCSGWSPRSPRSWRTASGASASSASTPWRPTGGCAPTGQRRPTTRSATSSSSSTAGGCCAASSRSWRRRSSRWPPAR